MCRFMTALNFTLPVVQPYDGDLYTNVTDGPFLFSVKRILERQWSRKESHVMKWIL